MEQCKICGNPVNTMSFRGTGVCGENCRKIRDGEIDDPKAQVHAAELSAPAVNKKRSTDFRGIQ